MAATLQIDTSTARPQRERWPAVGIAAVALAGFGLRLAALVGGGPLRLPVDYDEGVYSAAGQLLVAGRLPYRDFVFVHPPGVAALLAPLAALGPYRALVAARLLMCVLGAVNVALVAVLVRRAWGATAGLAAALVYAVWPEVVWVEHGVFIEAPLHLACLVTLACWQHARGVDEPASPWRSWTLAAGAAAGLAVGFKLWAVLLIVALAVWLPGDARARRLRRFAGGFGVASLAIWAPFVALGPAALWRNVVAFHLHRPADGVADPWERLAPMLAGRHTALALLVLAGIVATMLRPVGLQATALAWLALLVAAFLRSPAWWDQYNGALAPPAALLVGVAASRVPARWLAPAGLALLAVVAVSARTAWREGRTGPGEPALVADEIRQLASTNSTVCSYEPGWLLAAGHTPPDAAFPAVDSYAADIAADVEPQTHFGGCQYVAVGSRGWGQMTAESESWFRRSYEPVGLALWRRR